MADSIAGWANRNGCGTTKKETYKKGEVHCEAYDGCGTDVTLCTVEGAVTPGRAVARLRS